jgi:hypothetical protein
MDLVIPEPLFYMIRLFQALYEGIIASLVGRSRIALVTFIAGGLVFTAKSRIRLPSRPALRRQRRRVVLKMYR